jgi:quercetin dioxygenase-like cupin family protein
MDPNKLDQPMIAFAIAEEISKIKADQRSTNQGKRSAVLAKNEYVSIVLAVLSKGEALHEHETEGQITVTVVQGAIRFNALNERVRLSAGGLLTLRPGMRHSVEALEDCAFVITVCAQAKAPAPTS